jgi:hypothetical protein
VTAGKEGKVYLINRDGMGGYLGCGEMCDAVVQFLPSNTIRGGAQDTPALYQNRIYYAGAGDVVKAFGLSNGLLSTNPVSQANPPAFGNKGATPSISANADHDAIVWAIEYSGRNAVLHAYDAMDLSIELYNSTQVIDRDGIEGGSKFSVPTIVNGKVYVGTGQNSMTLGSLAVFGLLGGK